MLKSEVSGSNPGSVIISLYCKNSSGPPETHSVLSQHRSMINLPNSSKISSNASGDATGPLYQIDHSVELY